jgi:hypothetical protein
MSRRRLTRREQIKLACAAVGGVLSGAARALTHWLLTNHQG